VIAPAAAAIGDETQFTLTGEKVYYAGAPQVLPGPLQTEIKIKLEWSVSPEEGTEETPPPEVKIPF